MTQEEKKIFKTYIKNLKRDIKKTDHVIGSDELYDINFWISEIENLILNQ